jgi:molybdopterin synthase sulfur carrier subunit
MMRVSFFAGLRQIVGQKTVDILIPEGATVSQLIREIVRTYPALEQELMDEQQNLYQHVHIVINGRAIQFLDAGMDRVISSTDNISIIPAIGGG